MKIPKEIIEKWLELRSDQDMQKIAEVADVHAQTIRNAFNNKECSDEVFEAMAKFYKAKDELVKQYVPIKEEA